ncbi:hypothetical protein [Tomitella biformata]|uniref:hypothetical protein n=1 Tax=Tomitella biformata TaxID=630403 RepID=UPI000467BDAA|nr:hypothetical protein [Tomitella biformata]
MAISGTKTQLGARHVLSAALALIALQIAVRSWVAADGFFYWDDLILISRSGAMPLLSLDFLLYDHDGHLMPGAFLLAGITTKIAPLNWALPALTLIAMQALASLSVLRLLKLIMGWRPALLIPLAFYLFSPLTLPSFAWWANGLNQLPFQIALAWVAGDAILLQRTGRTRYAVTGTLVFLGSLLFFEKAALVPFVAFAVVWLLARAAGAPQSLRATARAGAKLWLPALVVLLGWAAVYLTRVDSRLTLGHLDMLPGLLEHGTSRGLVPTLVGGPWTWDRWPPSPPWATPSTVLIVLAWLALAAVVAGTLVRHRNIGWVWPAFGAYTLGSQLAMALTRSSEGTAYEIAQTLRYVADGAVVFAIALAIIATAPRREPQRLAPQPAVAGVLTLLFVASSLWSTATFMERWRENPTVDYVHNATRALAANTGTPLLSQPVSIWVLLPVASPNNETRNLFGPLRDRPPFEDWTDKLHMFDDDGHLVPAQVAPVRTMLDGPVPDCGTRVTGAAVEFEPGADATLELDQPVLEWEWTAQLNYLANRDGLVEVSMQNGEPVTVPVTGGLNTVYVRMIGGGYSVQVSAVTPDLNMCVGAGPLGAVTPVEAK